MLSKIIYAIKWMAGKQPYTLTLDECAQAAHIGFGGWLILIPCCWGVIHHFGLDVIAKFLWPWLLTGVAMLIGITSYKEYFNDVHNEGASYADGWRDQRNYLIGAAVILALIVIPFVI